jgi:hypothetical protein
MNARLGTIRVVRNFYYTIRDFCQRFFWWLSARIGRTVPFTLIFERREVDEMYVGYVDLLGFASMVRQDFKEAMDVYQYVLSEVQIDQTMFKKRVKIRVYSDAILLTSKDLAGIIHATNLLQMAALRNGHLVRGGIGFGKHIEVTTDSNLYVVSAALVNAVDIEKCIVHPCVALDPAITVPVDFWNADPEIPNAYRSLIFYEGRAIVNPCNPYWCLSAGDRVKQFLIDKPEFAAKYQWFLRLYDAIREKEPLVPRGP